MPYEPWDRPVASVFKIAAKYGATSTAVAYRNTFPAEPGSTYNITEHGAAMGSWEKFSIWGGGAGPYPRSEALNYLQLTEPPLLLEKMGLLPHVGPRPEIYLAFGGDRITAAALLALLQQGKQTDLTMMILHGTDKNKHVLWCTVEPNPGDPIDNNVILTAASQWTGPVEGPLWTFGTVPSQDIEADLRISQFLGTANFDYVMIVSDHAMARSSPPFTLCGWHQESVPQTWNGLFALYGPGIVQGANLGSVSSLDVTPTLAYLLGLPVASNLPGRVVTEAFTVGHLAANPIQYVPSW